MILNAYTLYDLKSGIHHPPFFFAHDALAMRAVLDLASDMSTAVGRHPADFMLCALGTYNDANANFANDYRQIATAIQILGTERPQPQMLPLENAAE